MLLALVELYHTLNNCSWNCNTSTCLRAATQRQEISGQDKS